MKESKEFNNNPPPLLNEKSVTTLSMMEAKPVVPAEKRRTFRPSRNESFIPIKQKNQKTIDELGFVEPNIRNAKPKISTWKNPDTNTNYGRVNRNMNIYGEPSNITTQAPKDISRRDNRRSLIKVNNWLVTPEPTATPLPTNDKYIDKQKRKPKNKLLPNIKKMNHNDAENEPSKSYFKKDIFVADPAEEMFKNSKTNYQVPQISNKAIYDLLNKLTNRRPVKINNSNIDLFADINDYSERPRQKVNLIRNKKVLKPIENNEDKFRRNHQPIKKNINRYTNNDKPESKQSYELKEQDEVKQHENNDKAEVKSILEENEPRMIDVNEEESPKASIISLKIAKDETPNDNKDIRFESLPLDLQIGKVPRNNNIYSMKPKKSYVKNMIQRHTSQVGSIKNTPTILPTNATSQNTPAAVKHTSYIHNPTEIKQKQLEEQNNKFNRSQVLPYTAKPLTFSANEDEFTAYLESYRDFNNYNQQQQQNVDPSIFGNYYSGKPATAPIPDFAGSSFSMSTYYSQQDGTNSYRTQPLTRNNVPLNNFESPSDINLTLTDLSSNNFQQTSSFKVSKPQLVGSLKIPGGDSLTSDSFVSTKTGVKLVNNLKLPYLTNSENIKEKKPDKPTYRMSQIYKEPPKTRPPKITPRKKSPPKKIEFFQKNQSPRKKAVSKPRQSVSKSVDGSPLVPGKLVPVYIYRHGRKLPVTSFRPFVPPPPKKEPKVIVSLESVLMGDLKLPFMRESTIDEYEELPVLEEESIIVDSPAQKSQEPTLLEELKLPVEKTMPKLVKEEIIDPPKIPTPTSKEQLKLENGKDFRKDYRGEFHYPPEYAQKVEDKDSEMPDMDKIEWEDYNEVVKPNDFPYDRPKSSKLDSSQTEKLKRVKVNKKVPFFDETGQLQKEDTIDETPYNSEVEPTPEPPLIPTIPKIPTPSPRTKAARPEKQKKAVKQKTVTVIKKVKKKKEKVEADDDTEYTEEEIEVEVEVEVEAEEMVEIEVEVDGKIEKKLVPKEKAKKKLEKLKKKAKKEKKVKKPREPGAPTPSESSSSSDSSESNESSLPTDSDEPDSIKSPSRIQSPKSQIPVIKVNEKERSRIEREQSLIKEKVRQRSLSLIEAEPKNEVVPIKSALKYRSNEQRANTIPQMKKKKKHKKPIVRFNVEGGAGTESYSDTDYSEIEDEEFYEFLKEHSNLDVNIEQHEANIRSFQQMKKRNKKSAASEHSEVHDFHFHMVNGSNRICCSAHRKRDPYFFVTSKVSSFANFGHQPSHKKHHIYSEKLNWNGDKFRIKSSFNDVNYNHESGKTSVYSKVRSQSNQNLHYIGKSNTMKIFSEKPKFHSEARIQAMSQMDLRDSNNNQNRNRILIYHDLPKWNNYVDSKVKSFENFNYKAETGNDPNSLKIYDEKKTMKWDSESRIKQIIYADNYIPQQQYFKIPKYKNNTYYKSEPRSITQGDTNSNNNNKLETGDKTNRSNQGKSMRWYPGSKIETFNIYYRPLRDLRGDQDYYDSKLKWNSEPSFNKAGSNYQINHENNNSKTPIYSEKLKWKSSSKIGGISWENFNYKVPESTNHLRPEYSQNPPDQSRIRNNNTSDYNDYNNSLTDSGTDISYNKYRKVVINPSRKEPREYLYKSKKEEDAERMKRLKVQYEKFKAAKMKRLQEKQQQQEYENIDATKVNSIQSFSKYKGLPQIKTSSTGFNTDRGFYANTDTRMTMRTRNNIKSSRSNYIEQVAKKKFVIPEIKHSTQRRFQWDQELKKRAQSQLQQEKQEINQSIEDLSMYDKDQAVNPSQLDINTPMLGINNQNENLNNQSTSDINGDKTRNDDSHLYGVELINDLKINEARKQSQSRKSIDFSRRSTPFSQVPNLNFDRDTPFDDAVRDDSPLDPLLDRATPRRIKKRIKQIKVKSRMEEQENTERAIESRNLRNNYDKHDPQLNGFELHGQNLRVESQTTVRPLANMNYKNAEDKAKVRVASQLYSSMMTPRSYMSHQDQYLD